MLPAEFLDGQLREQVRRRLAEFAREEIGRRLAPLIRLSDADLIGAARGLAFQLMEALGGLPAAQVRGAGRRRSTRPMRRRLRGLGVRLGAEMVYVAPILNPRAADTAGLLWAIYHGAALPAPSLRGSALPRDVGLADGLYAAMGYRVLGARVLRLDRVERLAAALRRLARQGPFAPLPELVQLAGCANAELPGVLAAMGYRAVVDESGLSFRAERRRTPRRRPPPPAPAEGPFAKLGSLRLAR